MKPFGDFVGRDKVTIKNYFVAGLPRLVIDYSSCIQDFLLEYLGSKRKRVPFGGRQPQLDELHAWLDDSAAPPYYLMSAEAGRGKSAPVCRWLAQLITRSDLDVIFVPISIRFETATQDVVFAALAAHLPAEQRQTVLNEALNAASHASALSSLAQPLADWSHGAAKPAYGAWVESLPVLAARPRPEFLQDLATLMPFTLALAGDEASQAAEGIFHAIQEVCAWWP